MGKKNNRKLKRGRDEMGTKAFHLLSVSIMGDTVFNSFLRGRRNREEITPLLSFFFIYIEVVANGQNPFNSHDRHA